MPLTRVFGFVMAVAVVALMTTDSFAQIRPAQKALRFLGQGYGNGYHKCSPGPNSDYYNPYSAHNSFLVSQSPQYLNAQMRQSTMQRLSQGTFYRGIPYSVYAAPQSRNTNSFQHYPGQMIDNSFEPIEATRVDGQFRPSEPDNDDEKADKKSDDSAFVPGRIEVMPSSTRQSNNGFSKTGFQLGPSSSAEDVTDSQGIATPEPKSPFDDDSNLYNPFDDE